MITVHKWGEKHLKFTKEGSFLGMRIIVISIQGMGGAFSAANNILETKRKKVF